MFGGLLGGLPICRRLVSTFQKVYEGEVETYLWKV